MVAAITVQSISKTFGQRRAVDAVNLSIQTGEMVALIGASGSGKSTLLRLIAGLVDADKDGGTIIAPQGRGKIGFIFQQFNLANRLPLIVNAATGLLSRMQWWRVGLGLFRKAELEQAYAALTRVGLAEYAWQRTGHLSGGQQQRGAIARALVQQSELLLADEPVASLDPESAAKVMGVLQSLNKDGLTILVSLHQVDLARKYCTRLIALKDGRVAYDGKASGISDTDLASLYGAQSPILEKAA
jgi:phosphonate transport system ATP-binding protein